MQGAGSAKKAARANGVSPSEGPLRPIAICPHCRNRIVLSLQAEAPIVLPASAVRPEASAKVRYCACGHPYSFHLNGGGACQHGRDTVTGGCECEGVHARRRGASASSSTTTMRTAGVDAAAGTTSAMRRLLVALKQRDPVPATPKQLALLTGYSRRKGGSGSFRAALASLRRTARIEKVDGEGLRLTDRGRLDAGDVAPLPVGEAYLTHWIEQLGTCAGSILQRVSLEYPRSVAVEEIADVLGYTSSAGSFRAALADLRLLDLLDGARGEPLRASNALMDRISNR